MSIIEQVPLRSRLLPGTTRVHYTETEGEPPTVVAVSPTRTEKSDFPEYSRERFETWNGVDEETFRRWRAARGIYPDHDNWECPNPHIVWGGDAQSTYEPFRLLYKHDTAPFWHSLAAPNIRDNGSWCHGANMYPRSHLEAWYTYWRARHNDHLTPLPCLGNNIPEEILDWALATYATPEEIQAIEGPLDPEAQELAMRARIVQDWTYQNAMRTHPTLAPSVLELAMALRRDEEFRDPNDAILARYRAVPFDGNDPRFPITTEQVGGDCQKAQCIRNDTYLPYWAGREDEYRDLKDGEQAGLRRREAEVAPHRRTEETYTAYAQLSRRVSMKMDRHWEAYEDDREDAVKRWRETKQFLRRMLERCNANFNQDYRYRKHVLWTASGWMRDLSQMARLLKNAVARGESRRYQWNNVLEALGLPSQGRALPTTTQSRWQSCVERQGLPQGLQTRRRRLVRGNQEVPPDDVTHRQLVRVVRRVLGPRLHEVRS
jgi:hypothetical protein